MDCFVCGDNNNRVILDKQPIPIWTGGDDSDVYRNNKITCKLLSCKSCGHVYQPREFVLASLLNEIYQSNHAQASTDLGKGKWGIQRAKQVLNALGKIQFDSVLEIGCGAGYLLKYLKSNFNIKIAEGIEPSLSKSVYADGVMLHKGFAGKEFNLSKKFNLIYSNAVFEHIADLHDLMTFIKSTLTNGGFLFFGVPNTEILIRSGDPGLFIHEHIHYFTKMSVQKLLEMHEFHIKQLIESHDGLYVWACKGRSEKTNYALESIQLSEYQKKIDHILSKVTSVLSSSKIGIHGVNNSLNNVLGWGSLDQMSFKIFDNDEIKYGKYYFRKKVMNPDMESIKDIESILVTSQFYFDEIFRQYRNMNFDGQVQCITEDNYDY
jgi:SAM-dependent methyltransferase